MKGSTEGAESVAEALGEREGLDYYLSSNLRSTRSHSWWMKLSKKGFKMKKAKEVA